MISRQAGLLSWILWLYCFDAVLLVVTGVTRDVQLPRSAGWKWLLCMLNLSNDVQKTVSAVENLPHVLTDIWAVASHLWGWKKRCPVLWLIWLVRFDHMILLLFSDEFLKMEDGCVMKSYICLFSARDPESAGSVTAAAHPHGCGNVRQGKTAFPLVTVYWWESSRWWCTQAELSCLLKVMERR